MDFHGHENIAKIISCTHLNVGCNRSFYYIRQCEEFHQSLH